MRRLISVLGEHFGQQPGGIAHPPQMVLGLRKPRRELRDPGPQIRHLAGCRLLPRGQTLPQIRVEKKP